MKMDKYELVLDIMEHPGNYTSDRLAEILSDSEIREIYNILSKTESALKTVEDADVDSEWADFSAKHPMSRRPRFMWSGSRAASIAAIVGTSIVAVAAGIAVNVAVVDHNPEPIDDSVIVAPAVAAMTDGTIITRDDSVKGSIVPVMFEDESLEKIVREIAEAYGVEVRFDNIDAASLHLYYKFNPLLPLDEIVEQLNTFEQINIARQDNLLIVD